MINHDRHSQDHWPPALPSELIRAGNVPAYFVKFQGAVLVGLLAPWLVDSGAIVTFETGHPAIAPQGIKASRHPSPQVHARQNTARR